MVSSRAGGRRPAGKSRYQARGGARAWKRRCGEDAEKTSACTQNRTPIFPAGRGDEGAAAGLTELARTITAQMAQ